MSAGRGRLAGRKLVVTGAASGMEPGIAELFTAEGADILLLDRDEERLRATAMKVAQPFLRCDVTDEQQVSEAVAFGLAQLGGIDGLLNVAGILVRADVAQTDYASFQRLFAVNLGGPFLLCRAALPYLQAAGRSTIVNVASLAGVRPQPGMACYSATKAGLIAFGEALSGEVGPNVRVNTICPGIIQTPMTDYLWGEGAPGNEGISKRVSVGRAGTPQEIADAALFLTSHESAFVNCANLIVSGGHVRR